MRAWAVSAGVHGALLVLAALCWPADPPAPVTLRIHRETAPAAAKTFAGGSPATPARVVRKPVVPDSLPESSGPDVPPPEPPMPSAAGDSGSPIALPEPLPDFPAAAPDRMGPRLLSAPTPAYPARLKAAGREGTVVVGVETDAGGVVVRVWVLSSSGQPEFDRRALAAVRDARFAPALEGQEPVTGETSVTVRFQLTS